MNPYQSTLKGFTSLLKVTLEKIEGMPEYDFQAGMIRSHIEINQGLLEMDLSAEQVLESEPALKKAIGSFLKFIAILLDDTVDNTLHILFSAKPM